MIPALAITYLLAGPRSVLARAGQLVLGLGAAVVAAGWWVLIVQLWPASKRPWIGGTQTNSILELTLRYNGIGRLNGDEPGSTGSPGFISPVHLGGRTSGHPWGQPGIGRLFEPEQIGGIGWLLPAALVFAIALLVWWARAPRRDRQRAGLLVWVLWLLTTGLVFSFMAGIFHPYYTVALAPPIAAVIGIGAAVCWREREKSWAKGVLATAVVLTAATSVLVLRHVPDYYPWLRWAVPIGAVVLLAGLVARSHPDAGCRRGRGAGGSRWPGRLQRHDGGARQRRRDADRRAGSPCRDRDDQGHRTGPAGRDHRGHRTRIPPAGRISGRRDASGGLHAAGLGRARPATGRPTRRRRASATPGWPPPSDRSVRPAINWPAVTR